jgi:hemolysin III
MLGAVWGIAVLGMLLKLWFIGLPRWISTVFYVLLGWAIVPFVQLVYSLRLPTGSFVSTATPWLLRNTYS